MSSKKSQDTALDALDRLIDGIEQPLSRWSELTKAVAVPLNIRAALISGRTALIHATPATNLEADQVKCLYDLIATLMDTNMALQAHAEQTAKMVSELKNHVKGLISYGQKIENFANFGRVMDGIE